MGRAKDFVGETPFFFFFSGWSSFGSTTSYKAALASAMVIRFAAMKCLPCRHDVIHRIHIISIDLRILRIVERIMQQTLEANGNHKYTRQPTKQ